MKDNALYLEVDEDITSAIDKLQKLSASSVQIVVPKRSTMLQSIINLKLLKKAADDSGKALVLVTGDRVATELAGRVGLAVAPSLGATAVMAEAVAPEPVSADEVIEADEPSAGGAAEVASAAAVEPLAASKRPQFERRAVDDGGTAAGDEAAAGDGPAAENESAGSDKPAGPKVPNFGQLQRRLLWVGLVLLLVGGYAFSMYYFTSAKVTLYAMASKTAIDTTLVADPNLEQTDLSSSALAAQTVTTNKSLSEAFTPTGQQDAGTKAGGQMTIYNNYDTSSHTLTAGTRLAAPDGNVFLTNADVTVPGETLSGSPATIHPGQATVAVTAAQNGDGYNEAPAKYTIVAYSGTMQADIYGQGAQMSGGTTKTVTVVTQADVDKAQADLLAKDKVASLQALGGHVPSGYVALTASQAQTVGNVAPSPAVGTIGTTATLTLTATYAELAVKKSDYTALIEAQEQKRLGNQSQIYDDGIGQAQVTAAGAADASGRQSFQFATNAYGGTKIDKTALAAQLKGKRQGDAADITGKLPGVQQTNITIWPAWITSMPARASQITITIQVADTGN